jgi:serine/threonine protein kinase/tetratricopeptide (TPR) repeat protein
VEIERLFARSSGVFGRINVDIVTCPTAIEIRQLLRGEMPRPQTVQLSKHVAGCSRCARSVRLLEKDVTVPSMALPSSGQHLEQARSDAVAAAQNTTTDERLRFLSPANGADELGWLAHYRILRVLGEGGMGIVLHAEDTQLKRAVAIKVIKGDFGRDQESRDRFLREARAMAQVKSDHVVTVYQVGQANDTCYIAMELLEGESLDSLLDKVLRPTLGEALRIGREIAQALLAAHIKGLIHRDIKPENVWLEEPTGRVKLLDFGLARPQSIDARLTSTGIIIGTPAYMAPEQARAGTLDERTDLFSLGCLLYELVAGQPPFYAVTITALLLAIVEQTPKPPSHFNPEVPPALDDLILNLLEKKPDDRPASAQSVIARLEMIESQARQSSIGDQATHAANLQSRPGSIRTDGMASTASHIRASVNSSQALASSMHAREAEHRQVTVLVCSCELFESEDYLEHLDNKARTQLVSTFHNICEQAVKQSDGIIVRWNDDSMLGCFGYPIAYEDAAPRAAKAALNILNSLKKIGETIRREHNVELSPWLCLNTGPVIIETKDDETSLVGEARNIAVRLKSVVEPDQIVCSAATHQLLHDQFECTSLGQQKIKTVKQPIALYQIHSLKEFATPIRRAERHGLTPFTGRENEFSLLKGRWEQVQDGTGQTVFLVGEAGLGKSRLAHELKKYILGSDEQASGAKRPNDIPVIEWYGSPHVQNTGLYPVATFFQRILQIGLGEPAESRLERLIDHLEKYNLAQPETVPLFASLLSIPVDEWYPPLGLSPVREREETFKALKEWMRAYAGEQPVLFTVEDLHWLDSSTLEFISQLLTEGMHDRMLTILTFRPEFQAPWPALSHQTSIGLSPLTRGQVGDLMRKKTGFDLSQTVVDQIYDRAGGVPLFIEEFMKIADESGALVQSSDQGKHLKTLLMRVIPATLQDLIMARLERLEGDREVAQLAATLGREFSYELFAAVACMGEQLDIELTKLVRAEVLQEKGRRPRSTFIFKNSLLLDALYNALVKSRREQCHARIVEILESQFPQIVAMQPELLANHALEANQIEKSVTYWLAAGLRSQEIFANLEAIGHFKRGLDLLARLPESPEREVSELLLLNPLGSAYQAARGYAAPEVGPAFARARELCQKIGLTSQLFAVMWGNWTWHLVRAELDQCMELADEMMAFAKDANDRGITMEAYVVPAVTRYYRGDFEGCRQLCQQAIDQYEDLEQCRIWCNSTGQNAAVVVRCYLSLALWHLGYADQAIKLNEEMLALAREIAHPFSLAHALYFTGWLNYQCRLADKLQAAAVETTAIATEQGFALWHATGTFLQGAGRFLKDGQGEEALPELNQGLVLFEELAAVLTVPAQLCVLAEAYAKSGKFSEARSALGTGLVMAKQNTDCSQEAELHRVNAELILLESDDRSAAEASFHKAIATAVQQQSLACQLRSTIGLARLWQEQGRHDEARNVLRTIYSAFTEGAVLPDLLRAKELLETLG